MNEEEVGTADDYLRALRTVQDSRRMGLLRAHFDAPGYRDLRRRFLP
jgi:hypothetical protein